MGGGLPSTGGRIRRSQWPAWSRVRILSAPTPSRADKSSILIGIPTLGELSIEKLSRGPDLFAGVRNRGIRRRRRTTGARPRSPLVTGTQFEAAVESEISTVGASTEPVPHQRGIHCVHLAPIRTPRRPQTKASHFAEDRTQTIWQRVLKNGPPPSTQVHTET
jgi:hypothetical protein